MAYLFGDVTTVPETPAFVKSRPIAGDNRNSVLLKLDRNRHFVFIRDKKAFSEKRDRLIGRGNMIQPHRVKFMEMYFGHPLCDLGHVSDRDEGTDRRWRVAKSTKAEHLDFKFILALEGNDVATNLKWVMSSNSLAVTPKPLYETWFMEGTLIPGRHYVEIRRDYADLEEKMNYYLEHPGEAERIIENAHLHVGQFRDKTLESIVSLLVLEKYFSLAAT
ncbi:MAG: glycosyltransferase [Planctomycetota bacterium]|nr:glycosyltransferase [Planctomycetota bacterium]